MKRLESNQPGQSWFCCPIHFTGVNCRRQDFRTVPFIYLIRIYHSIHFDQVYREQYKRNTVKIFLSRGRHVHHPMPAMQLSDQILREVLVPLLVECCEVLLQPELSC